MPSDPSNSTSESSNYTTVAAVAPASGPAPLSVPAQTPSPPRSPTQKPRSSRNPSVTSIGRKSHAPHHPSGLRQSRVPGESSSPEISRTGAFSSRDSAGKRPTFQGDNGIQTTESERAGIEEDYPDQHAEAHSFCSGHSHEPNVHTRLLSEHNWDNASGCGDENCRHGSFSIRPTSPRQGSFRSYCTFHSGVSEEGFGGAYPDPSAGGLGDAVDATHGLLGDAIADGLMGGGDGNKMSITKYLAKRHGVKARRRMYIFYYIPFLNWIRQYKWAYLKGDLVAAVTMASFYIPMSLSYASNLGHIPPVNGLYSFVFNPFIYALLGTCPQMVVGPEAAGSLLTGQVVRENISKKHWNDDDQTRNAQIAGMTTFMAGAVILLAGIFRLGFLDNVLSRPFLRGFISAIGIVILVDQLIPEMGLQKIAGSSVEHGSSVDKLIFIIRNGKYAHALTCAVSFGALAIIMVCREVKKRMQPRYPSVAYIPDRFIIVVLSAILAWQFDWESKGLDILGDIKARGKPFPVHFPLDIDHLKNASDAFSTSFVIALLGFFESSVAAKSLGIGENKKTGAGGIKNMHLSANRELVALGVANVVGGLFMALPAFGGYGRSKVNASTGGRTPMSSIFLSLITVAAVLVMLPWFYYLPHLQTYYFLFGFAMSLRFC
ncbi:hypothetical protein, variant [Verruconis gallopava]|uniref:SLC26A/SulP transporter domain-containing protein n=1 Tax=Verruconis gallopava TaxID=253628 RepID=A0A0D1X9F6_9PEZI|nr:hypothetical protein, variant [Verruconis gallopava]KIV98800.1 hypothetical protein, variant [Verruconis gallopava]